MKPLAALDIGNTRIKWGVYHAGQWLSHGALAKNDLALLQAHASIWHKNAVVLICNVAGKKMENALKEALRDFPQLHFLKTPASACGVTNTYDFPEKLGTDRFCAALGARASGLQDALIVSLGTATTIDVLSEEGFLGGAILPGLSLMKEALFKKTAQLPFAQANTIHFPAKNTEEAIASGVLMAHIGAIAQAHSAVGAHCPVLLTGGAAERLSPHLPLPHKIEEGLVLKGLLHFYQHEKGFS